MSSAPATVGGQWKASYLTLVHKLRIRREAMFETQDSMAFRLGIGRRTFQRWEAGEVDPPGMRLFQWAGMLGIKIYASDVALFAGLNPPR
jgi:DNA-binding XRE family transcriptional regulator